MSTAGKVLSILVGLFSIAWMILAAGVAQLNTNQNTILHDLQVQVEKLDGDFNQTKVDVMHLKDQTASIQEKVDRQLMVLRSKETDLEKARSQIVATLNGLKYQMETLNATLKESQATLEARNVELETEKRGLADTRAEVKTLIAQTTDLMNQLSSLRSTFQKTYSDSLDRLGGVKP